MRYELRYEGWSLRHGRAHDGLAVFLGIWDGRRLLSTAAAEVSPEVAAKLADDVPRERLVTALAAVSAELLGHALQRRDADAGLPTHIPLSLDRYEERVRAAARTSAGAVGQGSVLRVVEG